ncbi:hypothetical protein [Asticcacaulis solisilvae]|uniref:hypothetical protein n=1 Tax=Asticcacaulis solisilvae TaxID=1217274 RepID=UPI003FD77972
MDTREPKPKRYTFLTAGFMPIRTEADARTLTKQGAIAAGLLTLSELIGIVLSYFGVDLKTLQVTAADSVNIATFEGQLTVGIMAAMILVLVFMTWRIAAGRGYVSAALTLALLLYEAVSKILDRTLGGWMIFYFGMAVGLYGAIRACWWLRKSGPARKSAEVAAVFDAPKDADAPKDES